MTFSRSGREFAPKNQRRPRSNKQRIGEESKINRIRKILNEDARTLRDPFASQDDKLEALANREAARRQVPDYSRAERDLSNGMNNLLPADRTSIEQEMMNQPRNAHGFTTSPGSYEQYGSYEVTTRPRAITRNGNITNFGYPSEMGDRAKKLDRAIRVQDILRQNLDDQSLKYVNGVTTALKRQVAAGMANPQTAFQRYRATNITNYTAEQLALIGLNMGVLNERYDSTAGEYVVVMPFKNPQTPEDIIYNLKGTDGHTGEQVFEKQVGHYWMHDIDAKRQGPGMQVPPAKEDGEDKGLKYYRAGNQKSERSMKNPKRGDDYIRHSRLKNAVYEQEERKHIKVLEEIHKEINHYSKQLDSEHRWIRESALKNMKRIRNKLTNITAEREQVKKQQRDQEAKMANSEVQSYAEGISRLMDTDSREKIVAEQAYHRHLNLLDEAKDLLSRGSQGGNLFS
jgi:hypothetical protein